MPRVARAIPSSRWQCSTASVEHSPQAASATPELSGLTSDVLPVRMIRKPNNLLPKNKVSNGLQ